MHHHYAVISIGSGAGGGTLGVMLDEKIPRKSPGIRCRTCDGHPCVINAKADAQVCCIEPALEYPNVTLMTDAKITRLMTSHSDREVTTVLVERFGNTRELSADLVMVAAGAINSAALLLRSTNEVRPHGLANDSGVVSRHYICHTNPVLMALSKCEKPRICPPLGEGRGEGNSTIELSDGIRAA